MASHHITLFALAASSLALSCGATMMSACGLDLETDYTCLLQTTRKASKKAQHRGELNRKDQPSTEDKTPTESHQETTATTTTTAAPGLPGKLGVSRKDCDAKAEKLSPPWIGKEVDKNVSVVWADRSNEAVAGYHLTCNKSALDNCHITLRSPEQEKKRRKDGARSQCGEIHLARDGNQLKIVNTAVTVKNDIDRFCKTASCKADENNCKRYGYVALDLFESCGGKIGVKDSMTEGQREAEQVGERKEYEEKARKDEKNKDKAKRTAAGAKAKAATKKVANDSIVPYASQNGVDGQLSQEHEAQLDPTGLGT